MNKSFNKVTLIIAAPLVYLTIILLVPALIVGSIANIIHNDAIDKLTPPF